MVHELKVDTAYRPIDVSYSREGAAKVRGPRRSPFCSGLRLVMNKRISFSESKIIVVTAFRLDCLHLHQVIYRRKFAVEDMQLLKGIRITEHLMS